MGASFTVLNNLAAINGMNKLNINNVNLNNTLNRLASGKRINTGADDAAGLQIADNLRGNVMALNQSVRNANDGIAYLQVADGALEQVTTMLHRMVTLASQSATGTIENDNRSAIQAEVDALQQEISRIWEDTNFNSRTIFTGNDAELKVFVGDLLKNERTIDIKIERPTIDKIEVSVAANAFKALDNLSKALTAVASARGTIGAGINRLQSAINVIATQSQNTLAAESAIRDANMAEEITSLTRYQIMAQTGISALGQANMNSQTVLSLLR